MTLKQIAARAGLSPATVSYALRGDPKIPAETRARVQAVARTLGYRPNPRIAGLMAHIRRGRARPFGERIAFVWVHTTRAEAARSRFLQKILAAARTRAEQAGYALEQFWTADPGMTDRRLQKIIRARGILGVVLSPVINAETSVTLDWDWSAFAPAVIGNVTWTPELHHAGHHHYLGMRMCLLELAKLGAARPAAIVDAPTHERAKRAWEGAFLTFHPSPDAARELWALQRKDRETDLAGWLRAARADALIVSTTELLELRGLRSAVRQLKLPVVSLHWQEGEAPGIGGVAQDYGRVAAHAVDLVISQLNLNEFGAPDLPRIMLFTGHWVPPRRPRRGAARSGGARSPSGPGFSATPALSE